MQWKEGLGKGRVKRGVIYFTSAGSGGGQRKHEGSSVYMTRYGEYTFSFANVLLKYLSISVFELPVCIIETLRSPKNVTYMSLTNFPAVAVITVFKT